jgi:methyl-accepting chemotaxis protein
MGHLNIDRISKEFGLVVALLAGTSLAGFFGYTYLRSHHTSEIAQIKTDYNVKVHDETLMSKADDFTSMFKNMYESARTISLLPGMRQNAGGNRKADGPIGNNDGTTSEDAVEQGRLTTEASQTIQQVFNNLASDVSIGEVYTLGKGFNYLQNNDVPFTMNDTLKFGTQGEDTSAVDTTTSDTPVAYETAEYTYFPSVLSQFEKNFPKLNFASINDIPATFSPIMRTCLNDQYVSAANGNAAETNGIIYSLPYYGPDNAFKGIVAVIFRTNMLEAKLIGVPNLIITDQDRSDAKAAGWSMPSESANYVLYNEKYSTFIYDRRNANLASMVSSGSILNDAPNLLRVDVQTKGDADWKLAYAIPDKAYVAATANENSLYTLRIAGLISGAIAAYLVMLFIIRQTAQRRMLAKYGQILRAASKGDLSLRMDDSFQFDFKSIAVDYNAFLNAISEVIGRIKDSSGSLVWQGTSLGQSMHSISEKAGSLDSNSTDSAKSAERISQTIRDIHQKTDDATTAAGETSSLTNTSIKRSIEQLESVKKAVAEAQLSVSKLEKSATEIGEFVEVINAIAAQTNLLALNAAIEAARAGEAGRGFAVVADEVRKLAEGTTESTAKIEEMVHTIQKETQETSSQMKLASDVTTTGTEQADSDLKQIPLQLEQLQKALEEISLRTKEQVDAAEIISHSQGEVKAITTETAQEIGQSEVSIQDIAKIAKELDSLVQFFKTK